MKKKDSETHLADISRFSLDAEIFIPIKLNWRERYYKRVLVLRLVAFAWDFVPALVIYLLFSGKLIPLITLKTSISFRGGGDVLIFIILFILLVAFMESSKWKGTFGKRIMKIEITDHFGNSISFLKSLWRNFLKLVSFLLCFTIIGLFVQLLIFRKYKKLLHDKFSKTIIGERL